MNDQTTLPETGLIVMPQGKSLEALFRSENGLDQIINEIESRARSEVIDISTPAGRKACKSLAYKIAQAKNALDGEGKTLNEAMRAQIGAVDAERRRGWNRLEALQLEIRKPVDDWEAADKIRIEALQQRLRDFGVSMSPDSSAADLEALRQKIAGIEMGPSWEEFEPAAIADRLVALEKIGAYLAVAQRREDGERELAAMRAQIAERDRLETARLATEDAERRAEAARQQAEIDAREAKIANLQAEVERKEREAAAEAERVRASAAEAERIRAAAERAKADAEATAQADLRAAEERHQRELDEQTRRADQAAENERNRLAAARQAEREAQERRDASTRIRNRVRGEIVTALSAYTSNEQIVEALMAGKIPHTSVTL